MTTPADPNRPPPYTVENYQQDESIGFLVHQVKVRLTQAIDEQLGDVDITAPQWAVLKQIALRSGETASALCKCSGCDTGSMTRMLDRLEEKGLIRRERSTVDRRVVQLHVTDEGTALLPQVVPKVVQALNVAVGDFTPDELDLAKADLLKMSAEKDALQKRVKELEALPAPGKALLKAISKGEDVGGSPATKPPAIPEVKKGDGSLDEAASLIKFIHTHGGALAG